jgi:hypothetical protein
MFCRRTQLIAFAPAAIALIGLGALAQRGPTPDLSGTWVLNSAKSKVSKKVALDPETLVIKCPGNSIEIALYSGGKLELDTFVADGKDHAQDVGSGGQVYSKAQWKKSVLFTEMGGRVTGHGIGSYDFLIDKQRWSVSPDGLVLTRELEDPKEILVYDKRPGP